MSIPATLALTTMAIAAPDPRTKNLMPISTMELPLTLMWLVPSTKVWGRVRGSRNYIHQMPV